MFVSSRTSVRVSHLLVISKVVPKICARTNSAIFAAIGLVDQFRCGVRDADVGRWEGQAWEQV